MPGSRSRVRGAWLLVALLGLAACRSPLPPPQPRWQVLKPSTPAASARPQAATSAASPAPALPASPVAPASAAPVINLSSIPPAMPLPAPSTPAPLLIPPAPLPSGTPFGPATMATPRGRWVLSDWASLPGWHQDTLAQAWPALLRSCEKPHPAWTVVCRAALARGHADEIEVRDFLRSWLQPWRVENADGLADGLLTGYFEPYLEASRVPGGRFTVPLYSAPTDLGQRKPWFSRGQIDSHPAVQSLLRGRETAWLADPIDALVLHIQGSGRLMLQEPDGQRHLVRMAFAGHNDQPYLSVGRWLVDQGAFTLEQAGWPAIRNWARANPNRVREMLAANPRYVFFREEAIPDPELGPVGAQGVPLTPARSIAVDRDSIPYGTPVWLTSSEAGSGPWSAGANPRVLQRLVVAQDTGGAITGAVRADFFWGWGTTAEDNASRTKQPLRLWALWPR